MTAQCGHGQEQTQTQIADHRKKYPEWWIVLVDHMMGGTTEAVHVEHDWDRVLIIHPSNWGWAYEVGNS